MNKRKFEFVSTKWKDTKMPVKSTSGSAGYDFFCPIEITITPRTSCFVPTGIKAKFEKTEVMLLFNRSSNPVKRNLVMLNGTGVIDSDYYNNPDNEGEISFLLYNMGSEDITIKPGEKIGQGVFLTHLPVDNELITETVRTGGFGSTGK